MSPKALIDALNVLDMLLEYAEAELARSWFMAIPRRFVSALRTGIRHSKTDLSVLLDAPKGGA